MNRILSVQLLKLRKMHRYIMHLFCLFTVVKMILHLHSSKLPFWFHQCHTKIKYEQLATFNKLCRLCWEIKITQWKECFLMFA